MITLIAIIAGASVLGAAAASGGPDAWNDVLDAWESAVSKSMVDDAREDAAVAATETARKNLTDLRGRQNESFKKLFQVDRDYAAGRDDYEPVIQELEALWKTGDRNLLDHRFKLKEIATDEEWTAILQVMQKKVAKVKKQVDKVVEKKQESIEDNQEDLEKAEKKAEKKAAKESGDASN